MRSDVKAIQITATGQVFGGRTRLRGIILSNTTTTTDTGSITLQDISGTQFTAEVPPPYTWTPNTVCSILCMLLVYSIFVCNLRIQPLYAIFVLSSCAIFAAGTHTDPYRHSHCRVRSLYAIL